MSRRDKGPFWRSPGAPTGQHLNEEKPRHESVALLIKARPLTELYHCTLSSTLSPIVVMVIVTVVSVSVVPVAVRWIVIPMPANKGP